MGNGLTPGPANELGGAIQIDDGTLARTESPAPGPIGLDAPSGGSAKPGMGERIVGFARRQRGNQVGDGQCFALADEALTTAGARSAKDFGTITRKADYVWGTAVNLPDLQPGDVIQFRNYRYDRKVVVENPDGSGSTQTDSQDRPHHTAIVETVDGDGAVTVLEQNAPEGSPVQRAQLFFKDTSAGDGRRTTTIHVHGKFWFYRPQAR